VVLEAHVRDLNALAPIEVSETVRRGFKGLTAFAKHKHFYPSDLGVNAIELQPIHIFDTMDPAEYAWGYMPMNYFAPATQYADPADPLSAIADCREMIDTLHGRGLAVLLDVVYNHIGEPNFFQYIDKEYYFLLDEKGNYENHSGCGNTFDADTPMFRRLMRDSLVHWIEAYDVDGFRFDLGELIGVDAFRWLEGELKRVKPGIILIAEPWSFRGHIARQLRDTGFASWNDGFREYLRRYLTLQADASSLPFFVGGSAPDLSSFPAQTVNYVASHDDRCWIDKITQNPGHDGHLPTSIDRRRTHLMIATLMSCLGIPMLASGVDAMKSKGGVNNTYLRGELNAIPYSRQSEYSGTVEYFRRWIAFRRSHHGRLLRLHRSPTERYFRFFMEGHACAWLINADYSHGRDQLLFVVNPSYGFIDVRMDALRGMQLQQLCDTERWGDPYLSHPCFAHDGEVIKVPPMSCGLFLSML
jgi:pullulanase/glycogen debranching enzyme